MSQDEQYLKNVRLYKSVFETENGQRVLWDLMKASGFCVSGFDADPYKTAFNEGLRSMAIRIINILELDEEKVRNLMAEQRKADSYERSKFDV